jgi:hypothetical protein
LFFQEKAGMKGMLFQNFLDPIAKVWGVSPPGYYSVYSGKKEAKPEKRKIKNVKAGSRGTVHRAPTQKVILKRTVPHKPLIKGLITEGDFLDMDRKK